VNLLALLPGVVVFLAAGPAGAAASAQIEPAQTAVAPFDQSARTIDELLALGRPVVLAHNGGEWVHPGGTMFAFGESMKAGVDVLDLNVQLTADGVLVVQHDTDTQRTTDGGGIVVESTFAELHALDNAYWFMPGCTCADEPASAYLYRGVRTGDVAPPPGYAAEDFAMPSLEELLEAYPDIPLSIEIKDFGDNARAIADALVAMLRDYDRIDSVVVASFEDAIVDYVHGLEPALDATSLTTSIFHLLEGWPMQSYTRVIQPSTMFEDQPVFDAADLAAAHDDGYAVWLWPNDDAFENADAYTVFLTMGIDGINSNDPAVGVAAVEDFLAAR
jgi:glycerophosphoryl diester phosphodiesterase